MFPWASEKTWSKASIVIRTIKHDILNYSHKGPANLILNRPPILKQSGKSSGNCFFEDSKD